MVVVDEVTAVQLAAVLESYTVVDVLYCKYGTFVSCAQAVGAFIVKNQHNSSAKKRFKTGKTLCFI